MQKSHLHIAVKYVFKTKIYIAHNKKPKFYDNIYYINSLVENGKQTLDYTEIVVVNSAFSFDFLSIR